MNILVTGGNGFVGTALIKKLKTEGYNLYSIDDLSIGTQENEIEGVKYIYDDVNNIFNYEIPDIDFVFHLAGLSRIQPSFYDPIQTFIANSMTTQIICEWSRLSKVKRLIYSGSSSRWHNPYLSPYAVYKHLGEEVCKMYRKSYGMDTQIVRFYNVYGPGEIVDGDWAAVVGKWRRQVRDGESITIVGDGEQRRDFTHIDDIVDGLIKIMNTEHIVEDAWELGTGENYSINELYEMFNEKFGVGKVHIDDQIGNYRVTLRERDDALDVLGWLPTDKLKDYIKSL
jgi:UDP-glucose 4-epimerase